ncbi:MAG: D-alanine--D-alanine ligase [Alphaproteobacteria bacterium]|nr:D-alanine--D-alanine ligase [Alphaproteobacteria bacterium]
MNRHSHIAVLKGGWSAEREVSLASGAACAKALRECGYKVTEIDVQPDIAQKLAEIKPDVVFNALHGNYGEDGCIQGLLEIMKIPYTHSGVLASAVAMDKPLAKRIFEAAGLLCPHGLTLTMGELLKGGDPMPRPFVVKPASEGSSVGVYIVTAEDNRPLSVILDSDSRLTTHDSRLFLVEQYIPGREVTVAVLDDVPLGVTELRPHSGFYDYENKYTSGKTEHLCPAPLPSEQYQEVMQMALVAHRALGCRGLSRADFRYDDTVPHKGKFYLLEVNTQPGMTALSLSPELAAHAGISFNALVQKLVEGATLGH